VQFVSLDPAGRKRSEVARDWIDTLVAEIRSIDRQHLVTVGLVEWSLDRPGLTSGFIPAEACSRLDFLAVHLYPERGKLEAARETLRLFQSSGKPVLVEETFPLKATGAEFATFLDHCDRAGVGILGFFWGQTPAELMPPATIADALLKEWLEEFAVRATSRK
jgi:endo-1,4-beta-mannosidase